MHLNIVTWGYLDPEEVEDYLDSNKKYLSVYLDNAFNTTARIQVIPINGT